MSKGSFEKGFASNVLTDTFENICGKFKVHGRIYRSNIILNKNMIKKSYMQDPNGEIAISLIFDNIPDDIKFHIMSELSNLEFAEDEYGARFTRFTSARMSVGIKKGLYTTENFLDIKDKIGEKLAQRLIRLEDGTYDEDLVKEEYYHGDTDLIKIIEGKGILDINNRNELVMLYSDFAKHEKIMTKLIYMACYAMVEV